MSYELQVYALSPTSPPVAHLLAQASESGLRLEVIEAREAEGPWDDLKLRPAESGALGFSLAVSTELAAMKERFREDLEAGEQVPEQVLEAERLYLLELDDDADEASQAAFVVAAWSLATLTEAVVFDPQEEFFADADSFWALLNDDEFARDVFACGEETEAGDESDDQEEAADGEPTLPQGKEQDRRRRDGAD